MSLPGRWVAALQREWALYHLGDPRYRFMWDPPPPDEWVALDCETTGLNTRTDDIIAIGAVCLCGRTLLTSQRLDLLVRTDRPLSADSIKVHGLRAADLAQGLSADEAVQRLLHFIGSRPIVGYFLEFDVAMINRVLFPLLGLGLPQAKIEVSALYHQYKWQQLPVHQRDSTQIDLRFDRMMADLDLPQRPAHNAVNDAIMAGLAFLKLRSLDHQVR